MIRIFSFFLLCFLVIIFGQCSSKKEKKENDIDAEVVETIRLYFYREKAPFAHWNISSYKMTRSFTNAYNDSVIIYKVSQIIAREEYQNNFKKFLMSQEISSENLSFAYMSNGEFDSLKEKSQLMGYDLDIISETQSQIQELYDDIRIRNLELNRVPLGWEIEIEFSDNDLNNSDDTQSKRFIVIVSEDKKRVIRINRKSDVYFKQQHEIISKAIRENY